MFEKLKTAWIYVCSGQYINLKEKKKDKRCIYCNCKEEFCKFCKGSGRYQFCRCPFCNGHGYR